MVYTACMIEKVLYWAAGFIDADGSLYVWARPSYTVHGRPPHYSRYYSPVVSAANTDAGPPHLLHRLFGGQLRYQKRSANQLKDKPNAQDFWEWKIVGSGASAVARFLAPLLVRKHRQAQIIQDWPYMKTGPHPEGNDSIHVQHEQLQKQMQQLNHRGRD